MNQPFEASDLFLHQSITDIHCAYEQNLAACTVTAVNQAQDQFT